MIDAAEFGKRIASLVREETRKQLAPLQGENAALRAEVKELREALAAIPAGPKGEPGERGEKGDAGERGEAGPQGERGAPGAAGPAGAQGIQGEKGEKGMDGRDGRDGLAGVPGNPGEKGLDGRNGTDGSNGADGLGFDDLAVDFDGERTITLRFVQGDRSKEFTAVLPIPIDRGVFREGTKYARGDGATWGGSWWVAQKDNPQGKPDDGTGDWRLAVKQGRKGADGVDGKLPTPAPTVKVR